VNVGRHVVPGYNAKCRPDDFGINSVTIAHSVSTSSTVPHEGQRPFDVSWKKRVVFVFGPAAFAVPTSSAEGQEYAGGDG
jgi:hypothetical protein